VCKIFIGSVDTRSWPGRGEIATKHVSTKRRWPLVENGFTDDKYQSQQRFSGFMWFAISSSLASYNAPELLRMGAGYLNSKGVTVPLAVGAKGAP
jgi:hypothetical protein